ncbi:hypothetical protein PCCS19_04820 [Paenibacillus sp. CCS19]|uniref:GT-D fold domain-containing protein n=1 Tax=Paenibacillus sp. CCS19 TaxID=3158387 RepID=UPI00256024A0|nr:GT-D fold domain-containing glycosyltransferase [Paenibacillus cellulosilyticus]GMK37428.1 hypothetical protein PCCS19_04820 [Paenibacillus cellulosilyticus]
MVVRQTQLSALTSRKSVRSPSRATAIRRTPVRTGAGISKRKSRRGSIWTGTQSRKRSQLRRRSRGYGRRPLEQERLSADLSNPYPAQHELAAVVPAAPPTEPLQPNRLFGQVDDQAREEAIFAAGEELYEKAMPYGVILPDISLRDVIAAGVEQLLPLGIRLMSTIEVFNELETAIRDSTPYSVVRLGDGELMALAQDIVIPAEQTAAQAAFLPYAGVTPPDIVSRNLLATAIRQATIVGVPLSRRKQFQPLLYPALRGHHLDLRSMRLTISTINYGLYQERLLQRLLQGKNLLLIGNASPGLAEMLIERGYRVTGVIAPVRGMADVDRVVMEARGVDFDLALVAAGIPAVVIASRIAAELGKAALDFGHLADGITKRELSL